MSVYKHDLDFRTMKGTLKQIHKSIQKQYNEQWTMKGTLKQIHKSIQNNVVSLLGLVSTHKY